NDLDTLARSRPNAAILTPCRLRVIVTDTSGSWCRESRGKSATSAPASSEGYQGLGEERTKEGTPQPAGRQRQPFPAVQRRTRRCEGRPIETFDTSQEAGKSGPFGAFRPRGSQEAKRRRPSGLTARTPRSFKSRIARRGSK